MKVSYYDTILCDNDGPPTLPPGTKVVAHELICEGPPIRYCPPKPLNAEDVEKIVREAFKQLTDKNAGQGKRQAQSTTEAFAVDRRGGVERSSTKSDPVQPAGNGKEAVTNPSSVWLSPKAACDHTKCSRQTLWRWRRQGLRVGRGGRIQRSDLDAWLGGTEERQPDGCDGGELLRLSQAAAAAGVSLQTIYRWRNDGLKVQRRGRFVRIRAGVLDRFLRSRS